MTFLQRRTLGVIVTSLTPVARDIVIAGVALIGLGKSGQLDACLKLSVGFLAVNDQH